VDEDYSFDDGDVVPAASASPQPATGTLPPPASGPQPAAIGSAPPRGITPTLGDAMLSASALDAIEAKFTALLANQTEIDANWQWLDVNGNGKISQAEIDRWIVWKSYPELNHKPAIRRAYVRTLGEGNGDAYIQKHEFKLLLVNLIYFNRAYAMFHELDKSHDERIDFDGTHSSNMREHVVHVVVVAVAVAVAVVVAVAVAAAFAAAAAAAAISRGSARLPVSSPPPVF
jgi:hypothetical protein